MHIKTFNALLCSPLGLCFPPFGILARFFPGLIVIPQLLEALIPASYVSIFHPCLPSEWCVSLGDWSHSQRPYPGDACWIDLGYEEEGWGLR